jgi:DNA-binding transcriptional regulator YiaG
MLRCPERVDSNLDATRFSARSVEAQRRKTGLSAADYAKLVGVSTLTIYNWEQGKSSGGRSNLLRSWLYEASGSGRLR